MKQEIRPVPPTTTRDAQQTPEQMTRAVGAAALTTFSQALKDHLWSADIGLLDGDDPYAHGCTETGFYPDKVIDYDALCREIDEFTQAFINGKVA